MLSLAFSPFTGPKQWMWLRCKVVKDDVSADAEAHAGAGGFEALVLWASSRWLVMLQPIVFGQFGQQLIIDGNWIRCSWAVSQKGVPSFGGRQESASGPAVWRLRSGTTDYWVLGRDWYLRYRIPSWMGTRLSGRRMSKSVLAQRLFSWKDSDPSVLIDVQCFLLISRQVQSLAATLQYSGRSDAFNHFNWTLKKEGIWYTCKTFNLHIAKVDNSDGCWDLCCSFCIIS